MASYAIGAETCYIYIRGEFTEPFKVMEQAVGETDSPYAAVVSCLAAVLTHLWGDNTEVEADDGTEHPDRNAIPGGVDLLHAFPVADVGAGCAGGCSCGEPDVIPLSGVVQASEVK